MKRTLVREVLGVTLVLHGLANAVMPMRAIDAAGPGSWLASTMLIYELAILGFVAAGLGVMHVAVLRRLALPAVWIGGIAGLGAHLLKPDPDLWIGVAFSSTLPFLTTIFVLTEPAVRPGGGHAVAWRRVGAAAGLGFLVWIAMSALLWPVARDWGTTPAEWSMPLPGDTSPRRPEFEIMHAVTIDASPATVWSWLVQLGQDRAGFYSYDWLERLFGADIHNVLEIRPEWQTRAPGDRVFATQAVYLGRVLDERPGWRVLHAEPNRALVLEHWGAFVLFPQADGRTRLVIRSTISQERIPAWAAALNLTLFELPHFIMQRKMMLTIKAQSERPTT
jgi:uncharacterized protein YndB with AHSA1/START domain